MDFSEHLQVYLYMPFVLVGGGRVLLPLHKMFFSLGADLNIVWTPAFLRALRIWCEMFGMYGRQA